MHTITTENAPKAIGPYSQAIATEHLLFISGQLPIHPETGGLIGSDISEQTHQVLHNIQAILDKASLSFAAIVRVDLYLTDLNDFSTVNAIYASYFTHPSKPARTTIQVAKLPLDAKIEMTCIATFK